MGVRWQSSWNNAFIRNRAILSWGLSRSWFLEGAALSNPSQTWSKELVLHVRAGIRGGTKGRQNGPPALPFCWHCCPNTAVVSLCNIWTAEENNCGLGQCRYANVYCVSVMGICLLLVVVSLLQLFTGHLWSAFTTWAWRCRSLQSSSVCLNQSKFGLWLFLTGSPLTKCFWIGTCQFWLLLFRNGWI